MSGYHGVGCGTVIFLEKNIAKNLVMSKIVCNFALANETLDVSRAAKRCGSSAG